ncbi:MAG: TIGR00282 family metallophosphoesterase [Oscillospiraceae bacterium]|jgi:metallophosphoesterase (TIGR00282 family)|nr:TIGR00282 family metallophosphoesterase [Oscillospiraceae bacterium]
MNILCIGDVIGTVGSDFLRANLSGLKRLKGVDFVIANGENSADSNGITPASAQFLFDSGVDVITTGNHSFQRREMYDMYDSDSAVIRPANFPKGVPGKGVYIADLGRVQICVINLMGVVSLSPLDCPFETAQRITEENDCKIKIVDIHAEATAEKRALGFFLDGKVSAVFGTHTHVQTADEQIMKNGTGYITDVGMTGPINSCIGVKPELAIEKMRTKMPVRLNYADGECMMNCVIFSIDEKTGLCTDTERIDLR